MKTPNIGHFMSTNQPSFIGDDVASCQSWKQVKSGIRLIMEEQHRQNDLDPCSLEHGDHVDGKLALVAACYAEFAILPSTERVEQTLTRDRYWPWEEEWWKPKSPLQDLVHAGALIAAEIDRLLNAEPYITDQVAER